MEKLIITDDVAFLTKALGKKDKDSKYKLDAIYSTKIHKVPVLVCTDARRLHITENYQNIPEGIYGVIEDKKNKVLYLEKVDGKFPSIQQILENAQTTTGETRWWNQKEEKGCTANLSYTLAEFFRKYPGFIDLKFLQDLGNDYFDVWFRKNIEPVYFINNSRVAIVTPLSFQEANP
jgi:hypothetical protein